jgi:hypothetical protein
VKPSPTDKKPFSNALDASTLPSQDVSLATRIDRAINCLIALPSLDPFLYKNRILYFDIYGIFCDATCIQRPHRAATCPPVLAKFLIAACQQHNKSTGTIFSSRTHGTLSIIADQMSILSGMRAESGNYRIGGVYEHQ